MRGNNLNTMQLYPWILGRSKRFLPIMLTVILMYFLYKNTSSRQSIHPRGPISTEALTPPPLPPPPPRIDKWIVLSGYHEKLSWLCSQASMMFNSWKIAVLANDNESVYVCDTEISEPLTKIAEEFPGIRIPDSPLMWTFLYVIQQGAEAIYLPSKSWMKSMQDNPGVLLKRSHSGLVYKQRPMPVGNRTVKTIEFFTFKRHFGCHDVEGLSDLQMSYDLCEHELPSVQVPIILPMPKEEDTPSCDPRAPPVTIPEGVFVDDLQLTSGLYMNRAFWALVFPAILNDQTLPIRSLAMIRLLAQKVLWSAGQRVMLWHNSYNRLFSNSSGHTQLPDRDVITLDQIRNIYCHKNKPKECVIRCLTILNHEVLLRQQSIDHVGAWFEALKVLKVDVSVPRKKDKCFSKNVIFSAVDYSQKVYKRAHYSKAPYQPVLNVEASTEIIKTTCSGYEVPHDKINLTHPWDQFSDVLLIVTFNTAHYSVIPYLEALYRPFFPYMLYCGSGTPNHAQSEALKGLKFTFLTYPATPSGHFPGSFNYECVAMAMTMSYDVSGYAVISDDVLLSMANLKEHERHLVWFLDSSMLRIGDIRKARECRLGMCDYHPHWRWWEDYKQQNLGVMHKMKKGQKDNRLYHHCYNQLKSLTGGEFRMYGGISDFYYVPQRLAGDFSSLAFLFKNESIFLEIAIPTILNCLEHPDDIQKLPALYLWEKDRNSPWLHFNSNFKRKAFMHPVKWSPLLDRDKQHEEFFCVKVLPYLHDMLGRVSR